MADSVVSSMVTFVLENLTRLLLDEAKLLSGVEDQITSLHDELKFMNTFLKSSEGKRRNDVVKEVVSQIRNVAHQAEDVIDTYIVNITKHRRRNMFEKCFYYKGHVVMLHEVNDQIKKIKDRINEINNNKAKYGIEEGDFKSADQHNTVENAESLRRRRRDVEEDEVVGLVKDSSYVIKQLMRDDSSLTIVSIIGMGGLGKTTLARKIYNMDEVKEMFPCRAWGYVSNDYRDREFLLSLLQCMNKLSTYEYKDWSVEQLKEKVKKCLKGHRYLVLIDDIWKNQVWDELKGLFPEEKNGSRILITSRLKNVAPYSATTVHYELPFLNEEDSRKLFYMKVFRGKECPSELEELGRKMVENCKGLPLSIIALAELVSKKDKSPREWTRIKENFHWHLTREDNRRVMDVLKLSYDNLQQTLKPCFLYLGIYPEGYEIPVRELFRLWIAEGFVQPKETGTLGAPEPEDEADYNLDALVDQSLVQVASKRSDGGVKTCRIHSLFRDLCILESKANKFMEVCTELDMEKSSSRRLSLHCKTQFSPTKYSQPHPRSLFLFGDKLEWDSKSKGWKWIRKSLKLARVGDLYPVTFVSAPSDLKTMIHLRYLKVKALCSTIGSYILASICNLWNLETLHLLCEHGVTIPSGMWKLKRLRHVYFGGGGTLLKPPAHKSRGGNIETLMNLQTLGDVYFSPALVSVMNDDSFSNLTKLSLVYVTSSTQQLMSLYRLSKLRKLKIIWMRFYLRSDAKVFPTNLSKITLRELHQLDSGFMNSLGRLPNLRILKINSGVISGSVYCFSTEFPQLEVFHLVDIRVEGRWGQESGAMPRLQDLILHECQWQDEQGLLKPLYSLQQMSSSRKVTLD